ncbi:ATP-dependent DNA ligase [Brevibacillus nitrificans]|uniref:ATP-dependent DNA ligase n=1 Tax=Brevibacillus nitrificans TaxID=651560 RepID=UPI002628A97A|nr:hypothetical protein [Brevibacillus nitrificans]MED1793626.1 hypothetical protein [Brevibacillus nitrificans]
MEVDFVLNRRTKIAAAMKRNPVGMMVFDILFYDGKDLRGLPPMERKRILDEVVADSPFIHKIQYVEREGKAWGLVPAYRVSPSGWSMWKAVSFSPRPLLNSYCERIT